MIVTKQRPIARKGDIVAWESDAPMAKIMYDAYARVADPSWHGLAFSAQVRWLLVAARVRQMRGR